MLRLALAGCATAAALLAFRQSPSYASLERELAFPLFWPIASVQRVKRTKLLRLIVRAEEDQPGPLNDLNANDTYLPSLCSAGFRMRKLG